MRRIVGLSAILLSSCGSSSSGETADASSPRVDPEVWFEPVKTPEVNLPLSTSLVGRFAGGVCVLDADSDGHFDLFFPGMADGGGGSRLWMAGDGFVDETAKRGLAGIVGAGCVAADLDGDGDRDLVVVGRGIARLFVNDHGIFAEDSGRLAGAVGADSFATAVVAFDADADGDLDLAITTYGHYAPPAEGCDNVSCALAPTSWKGGTPRLMLQSATGDFVDASDHLGPTRDEPGLAILATDLDDDGAVDLFIGNDLGEFPDRYLHNDGKGFFTDVAAALGVATAATKKGVCTMSAIDGDLDADGALDLGESNWSTESSVIFRCAGGSCRDVSEELELFRKPLNLRWGQALADFDHDGLPELMEAVGHLYANEDISRDAPEGAGVISAPPILYARSSVERPFVLQPAKQGLARSTCGRGLVTLDLDDDGDLDVVLGAACGSPLVLRNVREKKGNALDLTLVGKGKNREAIGAKVLVTAGSRTWSAMVHAGDGFHGNSDGHVHLGLGPATTATITVRWPDGTRSTHTTAVGRRAIAEP